MAYYGGGGPGITVNIGGWNRGTWGGGGGYYRGRH
jgi:hypothetical protein